MYNLSQSGPDTDEAGEPITKSVATSEDINSLQRRGLELASDMNANNCMWINGPLGSSHWQLEISPYCHLGISKL